MAKEVKFPGFRLQPEFVDAHGNSYGTEFLNDEAMHAYKMTKSDFEVVEAGRKVLGKDGKVWVSTDDGWEHEKKGGLPKAENGVNKLRDMINERGFDSIGSYRRFFVDLDHVMVQMAVPYRGLIVKTDDGWLSVHGKGAVVAFEADAGIELLPFENEKELHVIVRREK